MLWRGNSSAWKVGGPSVGRSVRRAAGGRRASGRGAAGGGRRMTRGALAGGLGWVRDRGQLKALMRSNTGVGQAAPEFLWGEAEICCPGSGPPKSSDMWAHDLVQPALFNVRRSRISLTRAGPRDPAPPHLKKRRLRRLSFNTELWGAESGSTTFFGRPLLGRCVRRAAGGRVGRAGWGGKLA